MTAVKRGIVTIWGARRDLPCAGEHYVHFGGNTACLAVRADDHLVVFGAGTGLRPLGNRLMGEGGAIDADIVLLHTHLDQIQGIPFFKPFYLKANRFRLWAGHLGAGEGLSGAIAGMMQAPLFPIPPAVFSAALRYGDVPAGVPVTLPGGFALSAASVARRDGATGYRLTLPDGRSLACLPGIDDPAPPALERLCAGVDLLIAELAEGTHWHALHDFAARVGAQRLLLTGFGAELDDTALMAVGRATEGLSPPVRLAREGDEVEV